MLRCVGLYGRDSYVICFFNGPSGGSMTNKRQRDGVGRDSIDLASLQRRPTDRPTTAHTPHVVTQVFNELDNKDEADMLALASFFQTLCGAFFWRVQFLFSLGGLGREICSSFFLRIDRRAWILNGRKASRIDRDILIDQHPYTTSTPPPPKNKHKQPRPRGRGRRCSPRWTTSTRRSPVRFFGFVYVHVYITHIYM